LLSFLGTVAAMSYKTLLPSKVFETSFSMNIYEEQKVLEMPFKVKISKSYKMDLKLDAEGMLTDVQIYDTKGNLVYQNISEKFELSSWLKLKTGDYLFLITFIRNPDVMMQYFKERGYIFSQEQIDELKELFTTNQDDKFTSVSFSAVIK
jgi:hypothetical protein